jgi:hypothetical protein
VAIVLAFLCGIANFALREAVLQSDHPLLGRAPQVVHLLGGKMGLAVEFTMLLGSMLMIAAGATGWLWGYAAYSLVNALSAWLILSQRI